MNNKDYDNALKSVLKIEKLGDPLSVVKTNASDLKEQISKNSKILFMKTSLKVSSSLIDEGNFDMAESKLETLKNALGNDSNFTSQLEELTRIIKRIQDKASIPI